MSTERTLLLRWGLRFAELAALWPCLCRCSVGPDVVFIPLAVEFADGKSSADEAVEESIIVVRLSSPANESVRFSITTRDVTATGHDECATRDYSLVVGNTEFGPGETEALVRVRHLNDDLSEVDERVDLRLETVDGAHIGERSTHEHLIVDDDRSALLDVRADFGARADGTSDDSEAVQQAVDRAGLSPGAVILFPPGTYVLETIALIPGVSYFGYGAVITRPANRPRDQKGFMLRYSGDRDAAAILIQGFVFDGNRDEQAGSYTDWEYRNADLLDVSGDAARAGRLRLIAEDVAFRNTGASGLLLGPNTDTSLCSLSADDVFTDFVHLRGGNSRLVAQNLLAEGSTGTTGITMRSVAAGYGESSALDVELTDVTLKSGDLQITLTQGSSFIGRRVVVERAPFMIRAPHAHVEFEDSLITSGPALFDYNRVVAPSDVSFRRTTFVLTETPTLGVTLAEQDREILTLDVVWNDTELAYDDASEDRVLEVIDDQTLRLEDCSFELGTDVDAGDTSHAVGTSPFVLPNAAGPEVGSNNRIVVTGAALSEAFTGLFAPECDGCESAP